MAADESKKAGSDKQSQPRLNENNVQENESNSPRNSLGPRPHKMRREVCCLLQLCFLHLYLI